MRSQSSTEYAKRTFRTDEQHKEICSGVGRMADATVPSSRSLYCTLACQWLKKIEFGQLSPCGKMATKSTKRHKKNEAGLLLQERDRGLS